MSAAASAPQQPLAADDSKEQSEQQQRQQSSKKKKSPHTTTTTTANDDGTTTTTTVRTQNIWIVRHGDRQDKFDRQWKYSVPKERREDTPLSHIGRRQAVDVARHLEPHLATIRHVIASPFLRTIETSMPTARALGNMPVKLENGVWEALCRRPPPDHRRDEQFDNGAMIDQTYESTFTPQCREDRPASLERVRHATQCIVDKFPVTAGDLAIFSHCDPCIYLVATMCGMRVEQVPPVPPCTVFRVQRTWTTVSVSGSGQQPHTTERFELVQNSSIAHLSLLGPTGPGHPQYPVQCDWMNMLTPGFVDEEWPWRQSDEDQERFRRLKQCWAARYHCGPGSGMREGVYGQWPNCPW